MFETWPDTRTLNLAALMAPGYMFGSTVPYAVVAQSFLNDMYCDLISNSIQHVEPYNHSGCDATQTREISQSEYNAGLLFVQNTTQQVNNEYFKYDLAAESRAWHQTYSHEGSSYQKHMDGAPGVTRKLTAIVMLSDFVGYGGGELRCSIPGDGGEAFFFPPTSRGTVIWIQPWLTHWVTPVTRGKRESINMGFFGPPFK